MSGARIVLNSRYFHISLAGEKANGKHIMLSFITLHKEKGWQKHNYLALGCTALPALLRFLSEYPGIHQIVLCLDNDHAGIKADAIIQETLQRLSQGMYVENLSQEMREQLRQPYKVSILKSVRKDWNDDLRTSN